MKIVELILGDACLTLNNLTESMNNTFDFIFIDADKNNYIKYYEDSLTLLKQGGLIAIDNTIWKGKVLEKIGVYKKHALVLVNYGEESGNKIKNLSEEISKSVKEKFNIELEAEVNII